MEASIISEQAIAEALDTAISGNRVMLFMKGTPERPMCGFSMRVIQSLRDVDADFAAMDILPDPRIRQVLLLMLPVEWLEREGTLMVARAVL